jgi:RND family efflux transporter MFP subunit
MLERARNLWTKRLTGFISILLAATVLLLGAFRYGRHTPNVPTFEVKPGEFLDSLQFRGEITALKSISITAPGEAGELQIVKIASDGQKVNKGDVIVEFDKTKTEQDFKQNQSSLKYTSADVEQARALARLNEEQDLTALSKARFDLESAKLDATKKEIVSNIEGAEAELKVRDAEQKLREAEAKLKSDRTASEATINGKTEAGRKAAFDLHRARVALSKITLRAPATGIVSLVPVWRQEGPAPFKAGDRAWPGAPLIEMPDGSSLRVAARVDEIERSRVTGGQTVGVQFDAIPDRQFTGQIEEISTLASEDFNGGWPIQRNFNLRVQFDQADARLRPGMSAQVTAIVERIPAALSIPVQALFQKGSADVVYLWRASGFTEHSVHVGRRSGDRVLVTNGLHSGDRVALQDPTANGD